MAEIEEKSKETTENADNTTDKAPAETQATAETENETAAENDTAAVPDTPTVPQAAASAPQEQTAKPKKRKKKVIIILAVVLAVLIAVGAALAVFCEPVRNKINEVIGIEAGENNLFNSGLVNVKDGSGKWGYINTKGEYVISAQFDKAYEFNDGLALVKSGDLYGYIDKTGEYVINPQFDSAAFMFSDGLASA